MTNIKGLEESSLTLTKEEKIKRNREHFISSLSKLENKLLSKENILETIRTRRIYDVDKKPESDEYMLEKLKKGICCGSKYDYIKIVRDERFEKEVYKVIEYTKGCWNVSLNSDY